MVIAEARLLHMPGLPPHAGIIAIVVALVAAVKFTGWYTEWVRSRTPIRWGNRLLAAVGHSLPAPS